MDTFYRIFFFQFSLLATVKLSFPQKGSGLVRSSFLQNFLSTRTTDGASGRGSVSRHGGLTGTVPLGVSHPAQLRCSGQFLL